MVELSRLCPDRDRRMNIFVKQPHLEPMAVPVHASTKFSEVKKSLGLKNGSRFQLKGKSVSLSASVNDVGINDGEIIHAFAPSIPEARPEKRAALRLESGQVERKDRKSRAQPHLNTLHQGPG